MPRPRLTHCPRGHPFSPENTYTRPDGLGRMCRACLALRRREYRRRTRSAACPRCFGHGQFLIRAADGRLKRTLIPCPLCRETR